MADIAMGSGHFLVAAVDRIERAFSGFLARRPLPGVRRELASLRAAALESLGALSEQAEIEDTQLVRRLIARRCLYGVDLNPVSVNLARLSIWIHTFVPGLPLSLLDHNLVVGNSLVGVGRVEEIVEVANQGLSTGRRQITGQRQINAFRIDAQALFGAALEPLGRLAKLADANPPELQKARRALAAAKAAIEPARALCDLAVHCRMTGEPLPVDLDDWEAVKEGLAESRPCRAARKALAGLAPFHFPVAFPEVFLRERSGFDVILGNPPWEKPRVEEHGFWARREPGLRGLAQRERERVQAALRKDRPDLVELYEREVAEAEAMRAALVSGPYPGMGTGDPDLYKAFCWRFWQLAAPTGRIGVVLPRSAWNAKGSTEFRTAVFAQARSVDLTMLLNTRGWVFDEAEPRYTISLTSLERHAAGPSRVALRGPFASEERFAAGRLLTPAEFGGQEVAQWNDTASLPLLPTEESLEVFARLRAAPRLDLNDGAAWRARPHAELHATNDKSLMDLESESCPRGYWPVFKGESFDLWEPDRGPGTYYAWAKPGPVLEHLQEKRQRGRRLSSSVYSEFGGEREERWWRDAKTLPCQAPRIAFRDVTRATDSRTVRAALIAPKVFVNHLAPYLIWPRGDERDAAFLLGILSSLPLDWYARRFVETHLTFFVLAPFPIPRPDRANPLWQRVVAVSGRLAAADERFAPWAAAVGVECGPLAGEEKFDLVSELDALAAQLYGLEERHLEHVFQTFHEPWKPGTTADHPTLGNYNDRWERTREHFRRWGR